MKKTLSYLFIICGLFAASCASGPRPIVVNVPEGEVVEQAVPLTYGASCPTAQSSRLEGSTRVFTLGEGSHKIERVPKRLVCMDLDGTLTQHRTPLDSAARAALDKLGERYKLLMVGGGNATRIHNQMGGYPIEILGNYGMSHGDVVDGEWKIVRETTVPIDTAFFLEKTGYFREKYGYTEYYGEPLEYHPSGMVTFGLAGTKAPVEVKLAFDPDKAKRRAMYPEVCEVFKDYSVFIGGTTSFDFTPKEYNKYSAIIAYAAEHGYTPEEVIFFGDDMGEGGNDSHVRLGGLDYILVEDYRDFPALSAFLLD